MTILRTSVSLSTPWRQASRRAAAMAALAAASLVLVACDARQTVPAKRSQSFGPGLQDLPAPAPEVGDRLRAECSKAKEDVDAVPGPQEGWEAMAVAEPACLAYLAQFPQAPDRDEIRSIHHGVLAWQRRFQRLIDIQDLIRAGELDRSEEMLKEARRSSAYRPEDIELLQASHDRKSEEMYPGWLPWTLDMDGFGRGGCNRTELVRHLADARAWALQNGVIRVHSIQETPTKVVIHHYDGLVRAHGTRTFYQDMPTCRAERGE